MRDCDAPVCSYLQHVGPDLSDSCVIEANICEGWCGNDGRD